MKHLSLALCAGALACLTACDSSLEVEAPSAAASDASEPVAVIGATRYTQDQLTADLERRRADFERELEAYLKEVREQQLKAFEENEARLATRDFIQHTVIANAARKAGVRVTDHAALQAFVTQQVEARMATMELASPDEREAAWTAAYTDWLYGELRAQGVSCPRFPELEP